MRFRVALACAALLCVSGCASSGVRVERYRAAYSTHFEGIPDQTEACVVVRNRGARPLTWLELRLRVSSHFGGDVPLRSKWVYRGKIAPGESIALRFLYPPAADEIQVASSRAGTGRAGPASGRPLVRTDECSDSSVRAALDGRLRERTASAIEVHSAERVTPDSPDDALVAAP
jgi:hypothetical protein